MSASDKPAFFLTRQGLAILIAAVALAAAGATALLVNIFQKKVEQRNPYVRLVNVTENDTDPALWGRNWPAQYDGYKRTALPTKTRFGGHGGSEALPAEKIERDPWLKRMFLGYAFSIDYRDRRGHAYMLTDQEGTERLTKPQTGSCLHCHASIMPLYRELGGGDAMAGFRDTYKVSYKDLSKKLHDSGHAHPVSCVDCHDPKDMALRVTRPAFILGIQALAASDAPVPAIPSIEIWRAGKRDKPYEPNLDASRNELRSFVCGQCHVEYYCSGKMTLTFPWGKGLKVDDEEAFWNETKFADGHQFYDYEHAETGAPILKAQHPEFELWNQGIHARSGVACADCHMPYMREGATKVSDHWVRSPLLNVNRACQTCHRATEEEMKARVDVIQTRNHDLLQRGGSAIVELIDALVAAKKNGVAAERLDAARQLQRKSQWRLDYIAAENSMGFHAPQEAARVLGEAIDYARQGVATVLATGPLTPPAGVPNAPPATSASAAAVSKASSAAPSAAPPH
ncbi:MAG TPA: ammonia-forming cytochrome c nitrite reductase subunit c552 [Polyangiaceae bacterium]|jgi:nitrite reductase (cytochrome c-552)|nr:ammonia-forming cytochrome c nitrite reductase subunit c552 [Polyangiaceae bacterium]